MSTLGGNNLHVESMTSSHSTGTCSSIEYSNRGTCTDVSLCSHVEKTGDDFKVGVQALLSLAGTPQQPRDKAETIARPIVGAKRDDNIGKISNDAEESESENHRHRQCREAHIPTSSRASEVKAVVLEARPVLFWVGLPVDDVGNMMPTIAETHIQATPHLVGSVGELGIPATGKRKRADQKHSYNADDSPTQVKMTRVESKEAEYRLIESELTTGKNDYTDAKQLGQGNLRLSVILQNHLDSYEKTLAPTEGHIVMTMIDLLRSYGRRFLVAIQGGLREVGRCSLGERKVIAGFQTNTCGPSHHLIRFASSSEATISRHTKTPNDGISEDFNAVDRSDPLSHYHLCEEFTSRQGMHFDPYLHSDQRQIDECGTHMDVNETVDDDPEVIKASLELMDMEIEQRKAKFGAAYMLAERANPAFVQDHRLRVRCLRHCNFVGKDAALRMFDFLEAKLRYFGPDKIAERITLSNMGAGARSALEKGHVQLLPAKDPGGHQIIFNNVNYLHGFEDGDDMLRLSWYLTSIAIEDDDVQRKGIVYIQFKGGPQLGSVASQKDVLWNGLLATRCFPCELGGVHLVFDQTGMPFTWLLRFATTRWSRRLHIYEGTLKENIDALSACGIAREVIPVGEDGEILLENHKNWIHNRQIFESSQGALSLNDVSYNGMLCPTLGVQLITHPSEVDVLMGRGKRMQDHAGNMRLRSILEAHLKIYTKSRRSKKKDVAEVVVEKVQKGGGRFLRPAGEDCWVIAEIESSKKKVIHDFRTIRGILKKQQTKAACCNPCIDDEGDVTRQEPR